MSALERIAALLPGVPAPAPNDVDRTWLSTWLGAELPADYVAFLDTFGGGEIEGTLRILDPASSSPDHHPLRRLFVELAEMNRTLVHVPWEPPFVPWGVASDGTILSFLRRGGSERWVVAEGRSGLAPAKLRVHDRSMTELVAAVLAGEVKLGKTKKPAGPLRFVPAPRAAATSKTVTKKAATKKAATKKAATKKAATKKAATKKAATKPRARAAR